MASSVIYTVLAYIYVIEEHLPSLHRLVFQVLKDIFPAIVRSGFQMLPLQTNN